MNSMTPSQWLDIAVLAVAFIAAISGWRAGALGSMLSFGGVLLGATAGVLLAPHIVSQISAPRANCLPRCSDPGTGRSRRGRWCGAGPRRPQGDP